MNGFLGIDTSCYTTSVAFLGSAGQLVADFRKPLEVKTGGRGLAQSEMVFQHTRNLPVLIEKLACTLGGRLPENVAVGVSVSPRSAPDSYMPVFVTGESCARALAAANGTPIYRLSHQENHIYAGIRSVGWPKQRCFLAVHISGGTTEIVKVSAGASELTVEIIGTSADLQAGQFIDRIGVALGLPFPAGPHLEYLALQANGMVDIPSSCKGSNVSFSGPETYVQRLIAAGGNAAAIAAGVQHCIAQSVAAMIAAAAQQTQVNEVIIVGGVSANRYIRGYLTEVLEQKHIILMFPDNIYSSDNATGSAYYAFWRCTQEVASA